MTKEMDDWKKGGLKRRAHEKLINRLDALELTDDEYDNYYSDLFEEEVEKVKRKNKYMYYDKRRMEKENGISAVVKSK